jgi:hypothetical protein
MLHNHIECLNCRFFFSEASRYYRLPSNDAAPLVLPIVAEFNPVATVIPRTNLEGVQRLNLASVENLGQTLKRTLHAVGHI